MERIHDMLRLVRCWMAALNVPLRREHPRGRGELRLRHRISLLLLGTLDVDASIEDVLRLVHDTLQLRAATCVLGASERTRLVAWRVRSTTRSGVDVSEQDEESRGALAAHGAITRDPQARCDETSRDHLHLPLIVAGDEVVGSLHLHTTRAFSSRDLAFMSDVADQIAIVVHRARREEARRAALERRLARVLQERRQAEQEPALI